MPLSLYIHVPFCQAKCAYCDFASYPGLQVLFEQYVEAAVHEMRLAASGWVSTVYVGGGTPTILSPTLLARLLEAARTTFPLAPGAEITIEANPGTVGPATLTALRQLGATRLSLGIQSLSDPELRLLGRIHSAQQAFAAWDAARRAGFHNVNLDLIYGLPGQTVDAWRLSLQIALRLRPEHLSLYALSVEEGTPLADRIAAGDLAEPDPDLVAELYEYAERALAAAGYLHYEISNWACDEAHQCRHNLAYWRNEPYLGIGAGAHSWVGGRRWANVAWPPDYVTRLAGDRSPIEDEHEIGPSLEMGETMMMGLRLLEEGVAYDRFRQRFAADLRQCYTAELAELEELGLLELCPDRVRLTRRGHLLANQAFMRFLPES